MEIITDKYRRLAIIECCCCRELHTVEIVEDHNELFYVFKESQNYSFIDKLKRKFNLFMNWKEYAQGDKITQNGILLKYSQIKELYELLIKIFSDIAIDKNIKTDKLIPIKYTKSGIAMFSKEGINVNNDYEKILYDNGEIILLENIRLKSKNEYILIDDEFTLGYRLFEETKFKDIINIIRNKNFYNGNYEGYIDEKQVPDFINALAIAMDEYNYRIKENI